MIETAALSLLMVLAGWLTASVFARLPVNGMFTIAAVFGLSIGIYLEYGALYGVSFALPLSIALFYTFYTFYKRYSFMDDEQQHWFLHECDKKEEFMEPMLSMRYVDFKETVIMSESPEELYYKLYNYTEDAD